MNHLLRPRIWPSFLASSGVGPCDVPFRYASEPIPRYRGTSCQVAQTSSWSRDSNSSNIRARIIAENSPAFEVRTNGKKEEK
jgi:hypothetical protein